MSDKVVIVDYGTGNLSSVRRSMARIGVDCIVSSEIADIEGCDKLILAGVGHFETAMAGLRKPGLIDALEKAILVDKKPVLGICLGMEVMARSSEEGTTRGLGWLDATAVRFTTPPNSRYKVPNVGWNSVMETKKDNPLMKGIPETAEFYFLHSYHLRLSDETCLLNESRHESRFPAAVKKNNIFGVQFHPEKSHKAGLQLLKNFVDL
jgi:imidazole glycerol-phosphate synthase subunit HisH